MTSPELSARNFSRLSSYNCIEVAILVNDNSLTR